MSREFYSLLLDSGALVAHAWSRPAILERLRSWNEIREKSFTDPAALVFPRRCVALVRIKLKSPAPLAKRKRR